MRMASPVKRGRLAEAAQGLAQILSERRDRLSMVVKPIARAVPWPPWAKRLESWRDRGEPVPSPGIRVSPSDRIQATSRPSSQRRARPLSQGSPSSSAKPRIATPSRRSSASYEFKPPSTAASPNRHCRLRE